MTDTLDRCLCMLRDISQLSLRFRPKSDDPIMAFRSAMDLAAGLGSEDIARLHSDSGDALPFKLMYLSVLAAERAMNTRDPDWLQAALMGHVVEGFRLDPRENYLRLYAIAYAAYRAGLDISAARARIDGLLDETTRRHFASVFDSPLGEAALHAANLSIETGADGDLRFAPRS